MTEDKQGLPTEAEDEVPPKDPDVPAEADDDEEEGGEEIAVTPPSAPEEGAGS